MSFYTCFIVYNQFFFATIIQVPNCFWFSINPSRLEIFLNQADNFLDAVLHMSIIAALISKTDSRPVSSRLCLIRSPLMKKKKSLSAGKMCFHLTNWASWNNPIGIFTNIIMLPMKVPVMVSYSLAPTSESTVQDVNSVTNLSSRIATTLSTSQFKTARWRS